VRRSRPPAPAYASVAADHRGGAVGDRERDGIRVAADDVGQHGGVDDAQGLDPPHAIYDRTVRRTGVAADPDPPLTVFGPLAIGGGAACPHRAAATGARPRRLVLTGVESLTPSERRVAAMAAEGLTNPQIAQALFVSTRTVEGHLTHVFRKLDVVARSELAERMR
jgi:DNA-binding CsgD family transcriptional regulator